MGHICPDCVFDPGLRKYVGNEACAKECSFCGKEHENEFCAETEAVIQFAVEKILEYYEDPGNSVHYESAEGGFTLPTMESWELLDELGLNPANDRFLQLLQDKLDDESWMWVKRDPYASTYHEQLGYDWNEFSRQVKHESRFTFFLSSEKHLRDGDTAVEYPHEILGHIGHVVEATDSFLTLGPGDPLYRGRAHAPGIHFADMKALGPPPDESARQSRMSPAGISMFYAARHSHTVLAELQYAANKVVTIGEFKPRRALCLVDFSRDFWQDSIFACENEADSESAAFLNRFAAEIAKPISRDDLVHVEYVPTQVVTEYFRLLFTNKHHHIDGIAYRSSLHPGGVNVVLFTNQKTCKDMLSLASISEVPSGT